MIKYYEENIPLNSQSNEQMGNIFIPENEREAITLRNADSAILTGDIKFRDLKETYSDKPIDIFNLIAFLSSSDIKLLQILTLGNSLSTPGELWKELREMDLFFARVLSRNSSDIPGTDNTMSPLRSLASSQPLKELLESRIVIKISDKKIVTSSGRIVSHHPLYQLNHSHAGEILTTAWLVARLKQLGYDDLLSIFKAQRGNKYINYELASGRANFLRNAVLLYDYDVDSNFEMTLDDVEDLSKISINPNPKSRSDGLGLMLRPLIEAGLLERSIIKHRYVVDHLSSHIPENQEIIQTLDYLKNKYEENSFTLKDLTKTLSQFYTGNHFYATRDRMLKLYILKVQRSDISNNLHNDHLIYTLTKRGIEVTKILNEALLNPYDFLNINDVHSFARIMDKALPFQTKIPLNRLPTSLLEVYLYVFYINIEKAVQEFNRSRNSNFEG